MNLPKFRIDRIALSMKSNEKAIKILTDFGLAKWFVDDIKSEGIIYGGQGESESHSRLARLTADVDYPLEVEVIERVKDPKWVVDFPIGCLCMHVNDVQLAQFTAYLFDAGFCVAESVESKAHSSPAVKSSCRYRYVTFDTESVLGFHLRFIVLKDLRDAPKTEATDDNWPVQGARRVV